MCCLVMVSNALVTELQNWKCTERQFYNTRKIHNLCLLCIILVWPSGGMVEKEGKRENWGKRDYNYCCLSHHQKRDLSQWRTPKNSRKPILFDYICGIRFVCLNTLIKVDIHVKIAKSPRIGVLAEIRPTLNHKKNIFLRQRCVLQYLNQQNTTDQIEQVHLIYEGATVQRKLLIKQFTKNPYNSGNPSIKTIYS